MRDENDTETPLNAFQEKGTMLLCYLSHLQHPPYTGQVRKEGHDHRRLLHKQDRNGFEILALGVEKDNLGDPLIFIQN